MLKPLTLKFFLVICFGSMCEYCYAQRVLNGSFENSSLPASLIAGATGTLFDNYGPNSRCPFVEYSVEDQIMDNFRFGRGFVLKDTLEVLNWDTWSRAQQFNVKPAPHGKVYITIRGPIWPQGSPKLQQLMFLLSDSLEKGKRYSIRFFASNAMRGLPNRESPVAVGLSKNNKKVACVVDSFFMKDTVGFREYVTSFVADDSYRYIYLYLSNLYAFNVYDVMIDNVRLDTCVIALPKRTAGCLEFPAVVNAQPGGKEYFWNTGDTGSVITINKSGTYVSYAYDHAGCVTVDSIAVTDKYAPGHTTDTNMCTGLLTPVLAAQASDQYIWSTGETTQQIAAPLSNMYWVTRTTAGCVTSDTFNVKLVVPPTSSSVDTFYCATQSVTLTASTAQTYLWNKGQQIHSISTNTAGLYTVLKKNEHCLGIDSFYVTEKPLPVITSLTDTTVCFDEVAQILLDAGHFSSYLWKPTGETTQTIYSNTAQVYLLTVTDSNQCSTTKQVAVMETCPDFIYIPTAFTPNNDGVNDVFLPKTQSLQTYELSIINRWGAIVFTTQNPQLGWDGKDAPAGVYIAQIRYSAAGKSMKIVSQNVTLLR